MKQYADYTDIDYFDNDSDGDEENGGGGAPLSSSSSSSSSNIIHLMSILHVLKVSSGKSVVPCRVPKPPSLHFQPNGATTANHLTT